MEQVQIQRIESILQKAVKSSLIKSEISYELERGVNLSKVVRSGKFIKEKLLVYLASLKERLGEKKAMLNTCLEKFPQGMAPTQEPSSYCFCGIRKSAFGEYPKLFAYEEVQKYEQSIANEYPPMSSIYKATDLSEERLNIASKWNQCAREWIEMKADCLWLEEMISLIGDSDKIELTPFLVKMFV